MCNLYTFNEYNNNKNNNNNNNDNNNNDNNNNNKLNSNNNNNDNDKDDNVDVNYNDNDNKKLRIIMIIIILLSKKILKIANKLLRIPDLKSSALNHSTTLPPCKKDVKNQRPSNLSLFDVY